MEFKFVYVQDGKIIRTKTYNAAQFTFSAACERESEETKELGEHTCNLTIN